MRLDEFKALIERRLEEIEQYDPNAAPFGLNNEESMAWLSGAASALNWVFEQLPAKFDITPISGRWVCGSSD